MKKLLILLTSTMLALSAAECTGDHDHSTHANAPSKHEGEGEAHALNNVVLNDTVLNVTLFGEIKAGKEAVLAISIKRGDKPKALRAWIGIKNGKGSVKALLEADKENNYHAHLEVPETIPENSAIWLDATNEEGTRKRDSLAFPTKEDKSEKHEGHAHKEGEAHEHKHEDHKGHNHKETEAKEHKSEGHHEGHAHENHEAHKHEEPKKETTEEKKHDHANCGGHNNEHK